MFKTQLNRLLIAVVVINACVLVGCHRSYYRRQADAEAMRLIREKANDPRWNSSDGTIDIDPQSRMFNPFSQDHPPIPPDDAASHQLMHRVDGKEGYPHWHANGDTDAVESPDWRAYLPVNEEGKVVLTLDRAYQLALLHSPQLQQQHETLYRSALAVSLERFGFDSQLFSGFNTFLTTQGRFRGGGSSQTTVQSQIGANGGGANLRRLGITGTNFAVGLANTILFNLAGNNTQSATSLIDFSVIQPLLRGAGRERILESLTQSERTLLANVRQLERFKRGFYLNIAIGRNAGAGPNLNGNFLNNPGFGGSNAGGFFGLLQQQQVIRNQEFNVRQLEGVLKQFREFFANDRLDAVQLKLFETNVYRQQRSLLDQKTQYETSLDAFKVQLGLPPDLDVVIDDDFLDRFELISDQINDRLIEILKLREQTGVGLNEINAAIKDRDLPDFQWPTDLAERVQRLLPYINRAQSTLKAITEDDRMLLEQDFENLDSKRAGRLEYLDRLTREIQSGRIISNVDSDLFAASTVPEADRLRNSLLGDGVPKDPELNEPQPIIVRCEILKEKLNETLEKIQNFGEITKGMDQDTMADTLEKEFQELIPGQLAELNNLVLEMTLLQAFARSNSIVIQEVSIDDEQAIRVARCMRRDWMNARASLVDQFRNIEFVADQLEAGVDLVLQGDIGNNGDNPFKLRYENGQIRAGFRIDAPITRLAERNQYRQALISYQQSKRQFYQFEDSIKQNIRQLVRNIGRNKVLFELFRKTFQVEIERVETSRLELDKPVGPNGGGSQLGTSTARNLTEAIIGLNNAQNSFLSSWVQYEVLRRNLDFDMGTMMLDEMGQWRDPGPIDASVGVNAAAMMGIELDCQFCENIGSSYLPPLPETTEGDNDYKTEPSSPAEGFNLLDLQKMRARGNRRKDTPEQRKLELQLEQLRLQEQLQQDERIRELERLQELERLNRGGSNSGSLLPTVPSSPITTPITTGQPQWRTAERPVQTALSPQVKRNVGDQGFVRPVVAPINPAVRSLRTDPLRSAAPSRAATPDPRKTGPLVPSNAIESSWPNQTSTQPASASTQVPDGSTAEDRKDGRMPSEQASVQVPIDARNRIETRAAPAPLSIPVQSEIQLTASTAKATPTSIVTPDALAVEVQSLPVLPKDEALRSVEVRQRSAVALSNPPPAERPSGAQTGAASPDQRYSILEPVDRAVEQPVDKSRSTVDNRDSQNEEAFQWRNADSSFGGLLNRFK